MTAFVEIRTADLTGEALNWAVATACGHAVFLAEPNYAEHHRVMIRFTPDGCQFEYTKRFRPSTDWVQGGELIAKYRVDLIWERAGLMAAYLNDEEGYPETSDVYGPTHLIAACRAIVASVLGETVSVPKELV